MFVISFFTGMISLADYLSLYNQSYFDSPLCVWLAFVILQLMIPIHFGVLNKLFESMSGEPIWKH